MLEAAASCEQKEVDSDIAADFFDMQQAVARVAKDPAAARRAAQEFDNKTQSEGSSEESFGKVSSSIDSDANSLDCNGDVQGGGDESVLIDDGEEGPALVGDAERVGRGPARKRQRTLQEKSDLIQNNEGDWGVHYICWERYARGSTRGCWRGLCKSHKHSEHTGCRKVFPKGGVDQSDEAGVQSALNMCRHWLNCSVNHKRKQTHCMFGTKLKDTDVPDTHLLFVNLVVELPQDVKPDAELDFEEGVGVVPTVTDPKSKKAFPVNVPQELDKSNTGSSSSSSSSSTSSSDAG